jgi:hypothetical protein
VGFSRPASKPPRRRDHACPATGAQSCVKTLLKWLSRLAFAAFNWQGAGMIV